jgi:DNA polymerase-3 subunit beta
MKFAIPKAILNDALSRLMGVIERRSTLPILANISIETGHERLRLVATDMDMEASEWIEARIAEPGKITVNASLLHDISKKLATDLVHFSLRDYRMNITGGEAKFTLGTLAAEDFPQFKDDAGAACHVMMDSEELRKLIDGVKGAMSNEETRYYLNGACFHALPEGVTGFRAVATDGHRLARADAVAKEITGTMNQAIIPRKALTEMRRIVEKPCGDVRLTLRENSVTLECGLMTLKSKLVDGVFPDYERVIPSQAAVHTFTIATVPFRDAVERVGSVATKTSGIKLAFGTEAVELSCSSADGDLAEALDEIPVAGTGKIECGFNASFLAEMTSHFPGEFTLELIDPQSPARISGKDDPTYLYILMPMRV